MILSLFRFKLLLCKKKSSEIQRAILYLPLIALDM